MWNSSSHGASGFVFAIDSIKACMRSSAYIRKQIEYIKMKEILTRRKEKSLIPLKIFQKITQGLVQTDDRSPCKILSADSLVNISCIDIDKRFGSFK